MKRILLFTLLQVTLINSGLFCQTRLENKTIFSDAESWILFEDYKEALPKYQQLLKYYPDTSYLKSNHKEKATDKVASSEEPDKNAVDMPSGNIAARMISGQYTLTWRTWILFGSGICFIFFILWRKSRKKEK